MGNKFHAKCQCLYIVKIAQDVILCNRAASLEGLALDVPRPSFAEVTLDSSGQFITCM